jgi:hypothetical protein
VEVGFVVSVDTSNDCSIEGAHGHHHRSPHSRHHDDGLHHDTLSAEDLDGHNLRHHGDLDHVVGLDLVSDLHAELVADLDGFALETGCERLQHRLVTLVDKLLHFAKLFVSVFFLVGEDIRRGNLQEELLLDADARIDDLYAAEVLLTFVDLSHEFVIFRPLAFSVEELNLALESNRK